jgi:hypothetical protein
MSREASPRISLVQRAVLTAAVIVGAGAAFAPLGAATAPGGAFCSVWPPIEFSAQRTRRIVQEAEVVVRATAIGRAPAPPHARRGATYVSFTVREVLEGTPPADTLVFMGGLDDRDSFRPEDEDDVPYQSFYRWYGGGDCIAATYRPGAEYLLLLGRRGDEAVLDPYWALLAPTTEQVRGPDDPWVRWVRKTLGGRAAPSGARG